MRKFAWRLKQLIPSLWVSEYSTNGHREVAVWRMWFGHTSSIKRWKIA